MGYFIKCYYDSINKLPLIRLSNVYVGKEIPRGIYLHATELHYICISIRKGCKLISNFSYIPLTFESKCYQKPEAIYLIFYSAILYSLQV